MSDGGERPVLEYDTPALPVPRSARIVKNPRDVPEYVGLKVAGTVLRWAGYLCYVVAVAILCGLASARADGPTFSQFATALVGGAFAHAAGEGALALRDLVRNSFR